MKLSLSHKQKIIKLKTEGFSYNNIRAKLEAEDSLFVSKQSIYIFCKKYKQHGLHFPQVNYESRYSGHLYLFAQAAWATLGSCPTSLFIPGQLPKLPSLVPLPDMPIHITII
jgi:hypothetical protein